MPHPGSFELARVQESYTHIEEHLEAMLALLSLYELLRKRIETDVAFTREYTWDIESKECKASTRSRTSSTGPIREREVSG